MLMQPSFTVHTASGLADHFLFEIPKTETRCSLNSNYLFKIFQRLVGDEKNVYKFSTNMKY